MWLSLGLLKFLTNMCVFYEVKVYMYKGNDFIKYNKYTKVKESRVGSSVDFFWM